MDALRALSALLDAKAPADAAAYKTWLCHVANAVAEAAPEGGFLGFGGTQVSEAEKTSVAQIASALGVSVPAGATRFGGTRARLNRITALTPRMTV